MAETYIKKSDLDAFCAHLQALGYGVKRHVHNNQVTKVRKDGHWMSIYARRCGDRLTVDKRLAEEVRAFGQRGAFEPPEPKLTADARVANATFRKGVPERLVIDAAIRSAALHADMEALTPEQMIEQERNRRAVWDMIHGPLSATPSPDGCGCCGDACKSRGVCRLADESPAAHRLDPVASAWADMAANGLQWLRNVRDGIADVSVAVREMESGVRSCEMIPSESAKTPDLHQIANTEQPPAPQSTVIKIVAAHLCLIGADGLVRPEMECGCELSNLAPCGGEIGDCTPGWKGAPVCADHGEWTMFASKDQAKASREGGAA